MREKKTILLIEQLNLLTLGYCLVFRNRFDEILYIDASFLGNLITKKMGGLHGFLLHNFRQIFHYEFSGSWYDQIIEAGTNVNDKLFEKYSQNIFVTSVLKFGKNPLYSLAIRKEIFNRYTLVRVKTFIFLKPLSEKYDSITFLPIDAENIFSLLSEKQQPRENITTPAFFTRILEIAGFFCRVFAVVIYPVILMGIAVKFLIHGVCATPKKKETYNYGIDTFSEGIPWRVPYNSFFIYNKTDFHPTKILHVLRTPLTDEKTLKKFSKYHYPQAVWNAQKTPVQFFFSRILFEMLLLQTKNFLAGLFGSDNKNHIFLTPCLALSKMIVETEVFFHHYEVKVFISRDDYSPLHVVRTIIARENNSSTIGFMHGDYTIPGVETVSNLLLDKYAMYGSFYLNLHKKGVALCDVGIIGAGIYGLDRTYRLSQRGYIPEKYRALKKSYKILLIIGGPYNVRDTDSGFTKDLIIQYYKDILDLTEEYTDYYRIIKPAGDDRLDEDLKKVISGHERVSIEKNLWTYKIILLADLTICYAQTTVGLESIMAGKPTFYYDLSGYKNHAYAKFSPHLVVRTPDDLRKNLNYIIREKQYLDDEILEHIRQYHGLRFDGNVVHRFHQLCRSILQTPQSRAPDDPVKRD